MLPVALPQNDSLDRTYLNFGTAHSAWFPTIDILIFYRYLECLPCLQYGITHRVGQRIETMQLLIMLDLPPPLPPFNPRSLRNVQGRRFCWSAQEAFPPKRTGGQRVPGASRGVSARGEKKASQEQNRQQKKVTSTKNNKHGMKKQNNVFFLRLQRTSCLFSFSRYSEFFSTEHPVEYQQQPTACNKGKRPGTGARSCTVVRSGPETGRK